MKKVIVIVAVAMLISGNCFAQSKEDLVKKYNSLSNEVKQLSEAIQTRQRSMIEIEGILKYLGEQEKSNKKDVVIKEEQKK